MDRQYIALFKVNGDICFLSHLELMKVFRQALRRANVPVAYSEGFNPHMKLSFAIAKGVGLESAGEILEIQTIQPLTETLVTLAVNKVLPEGLQVLEIKERERGKSLSALLKKSRYQCTFNGGDKEAIEAFLNKKEIVLTLKTKKGPKEKEVKELIYDYTLSEKENAVALDIMVAAGSEKNLRIDAFIAGVCDAIGYEGDVCIHRVSLLGEKGLLFDAV